MLRYSREHSKNYLDTFGFLPLTLPHNFDYAQLSLEVNRESVRTMSQSWADIVKQKRSFIVPAFADHSAAASSFMVSHLDPVIRGLVGKNYFYIGSDASTFFAAGSAWHRDMALRLPLLKLNIYIDFNSKDESFEFLIVPGSHHVGSAYSSLLQKAAAWPDVLGLEGGFSERNFLPPGSDPTSSCYDHRSDPIPSHAVTIKPGGAIIFNTAALHAVKSCCPTGRPRRLVTFIFCANPIDLSDCHFCREPSGRNYSDAELLDELYTWRAMECARFGVYDYGPELKKYPDYIKAHGVDWEKITKMSRELELDLKLEDGSHEQVQVKKMSNFLLQNVHNITGEMRS